MAKQKRGNKRPDARQRQAMFELMGLTKVLTVIVTVGADVLQRDFEFTQEQATDWAKKTIQAAHELLDGDEV